MTLIRGSIARSLAGTDKTNLGRVIEDIQTSYRTFTTFPYKHDAYAARASFELAMCYLYRDDFQKARIEIGKTEQSAKNSDEWLAKVHIVRSRIARREGSIQAKAGNESRASDLAGQALKHAENAKKLADELKLPLITIDTLIVQGEALLLRKKVQEAQCAFTTALSILQPPGRATMNNPKVEGILYVHLARSFLLENNPGAAESWLNRWNAVKATVEHRLVHEMANEVSEEVTASKRDFMISWQITSLNYKKYRDDLFKWLYDRASFDNPAQIHIASRLGLDRVTLSNWKKRVIDKKA